MVAALLCWITTVAALYTQKQISLETDASFNQRDAGLQEKDSQSKLDESSDISQDGLAQEASFELNASASCAATKCVGERKSQIVLTGFHNKIGAGIGDRAHLLTEMANIAEHFCAHLVVACRPCDAMGRHGEISCETSWSDYLGMSARGQPMLFSSVMPDDVDPTDVRMNYNPYQDVGHRPEAAPCPPAFECVGPQNARYPLMQQAERVAEAFKHGSPFVWYLDGPSFYSLTMPSIDRAMKSLKAKDGLQWPPCKTVTLTGSEPVKEACHKVLQYFNLNDGSDYKTMHIRRGDAMADCDTSIDAVRAYAKSHILPKVTTPGAKLVFFTDETSEEYLAALKAALADLHIEALHGDEAARAAGGSARFNDNYFLMQVQRVVNGHCTGAIDPPSFQLDRQSCEEKRTDLSREY